MSILALSFKSLRNRTFTVLLTVTVIALSITLLLGVERIRHEARTSFTSTISGTDLIVGARSGRIALLLSTVFHIGSAENSISWNSFEEFAEHPQVRWAIPLSLGDSHKGYRVLGTTGEYYDRFRFARDRGLELRSGRWFAADNELVLGAEAADKLGYRLGDSVIVSHGIGEFSFHNHKEKPFTVVGILQSTGTPVDRTLHVDLSGIERIHAKPVVDAGLETLEVLFVEGGERSHTELQHGGDVHGKHEPEQITAFLLGLKNRGAALGLQRMINTFEGEPLTAAMPGMTLQELWDAIGVAENALMAVAAFVVVVGLFGLLATLLTSLNERRREMAILRSVGARPRHLFSLMVGEAALVTMIGTVAGVAILQLLLAIGQPLIASRFGIYLQAGGMNGNQLLVVTLVCVCGALIGLIPGYRVYRYSLADGMTVKL